MNKEKGYVTGPNWVHISTIPLKLADFRKMAKQTPKEAISGTSQIAQLRSQKESVAVQKSTKLFKFRETSTDNYKQHIFKVVLIKEGLGNFRDRFFYSKQALKTAAERGIFNGVQAFADHPSAIEEEVRPERSTEDIIGYYQNVKFEEAEDGQGYLIADLSVSTTVSKDWVLALLTNSVDYSTKFKERDLVGLSINASGPAQSMALDEFMSQQKWPEPILLKLMDAKAQGVEEINVVNELTEVTSVDLVTKAGAGGRIQRMVEGGKKNGKEIRS